MAGRTTVTVQDPILSWEMEAGLEDPVPASEILDRTVKYVLSKLLGTAADGPALLRELRFAAARALRTQAEMRMAVCDLGRLDGMAAKLALREESPGSFVVEVPEGWIEELDRVFRTRTCSRCGSTVPGVPHPDADCDEALARRIMEE